MGARGRAPRTRARWALLGAGLAWGLTGLVSPATAHTTPALLAAETDYLVKWHQPHGNPPAEDWDIEVTPVDGSPSFVLAAQVMPDDSCWALDVPVDGPARVRVRAVNGALTSAWSGYTTVPEPGFALTSFVALGFVGCLAARRRKPTRKRQALRAGCSPISPRRAG